MVLNERYTQGERHSLDNMRHGAREPSPEARVRFDDEALRWVRERQPYVFLREEYDAGGPVFVNAMRDEPSLVSWLLQWGRAVEVLSPDSLRAAVATEARALLAHHEAPGTPMREIFSAR